MTVNLARDAVGLAVPETADSEGIKNARILIADDDPLCRQLVGGILRAQNFKNLQFAAGGLEAMEQVRSFRPDLLLLICRCRT